MSAAEVHPNATLTPSKLDLLREWLPRQAWFVGHVDDLERVAAFRFVDPAGKVGLDNMIIKSRGTSFFVPVTWRDTPSSLASLIGTLEHSELGTRYCYDAATDLTYLAEIRRVIREGDTNTAVVDTDGNAQPLTVNAYGSVVPADVVTTQVTIVREIGRAAELRDDVVGTLTAEWNDGGHSRREVLAILS